MDLKMSNLISGEYNEAEPFINSINSKLVMDVSQNEIVQDDEWIDITLFTLPYIEKALNKPNKNIVTEEEIVKIELIKKVTVESIKHLSKNTNLIAEYNEKTQDVIPSKILNAYKEESYVTYENRFVYSLIKLLEDFIFLMTEKGDKEELKVKNYKKANYEATTKIRNEKVTLNFEYLAEKVANQDIDKENEEKIREIKNGLRMLKATEMYQLLDSKRIVLVKSPLKMTNVLLKNVNFQYCVKLWQYLTDHMDAKAKAIKAKRNFEEKGITKELIDEDFFVKYLVFSYMQSSAKEKRNGKRVALNLKEKRELTDKLIEKVLDLNPEMHDQDLKKLIAEKYIIYKTKKGISLKPLEDAFQKNIDEYLQSIEKVRLRLR